MLIQISFKHMKSSDHLKEYANEKSERLKKYFDGKIHITWTLSVEKAGHIAHCHLVGNHMDYFGEGTEENMHAAIDTTIDRIEAQIRKHKEIVTKHHPH